MQDNTVLYIVLLFIFIGTIHYIMIKNDKIENLVITDSTYSNCRVGCYIACSDKYHHFVPRCYKPCVAQCWNY